MLSCEKELWKSTKLENKAKMTSRGKIVATGIVGISMIPGEKILTEEGIKMVHHQHRGLAMEADPFTPAIKLSGQHRLAAWFTVGCKHINTYFPFLFVQILCYLQETKITFILFECVHPSCSVFVHGKSCPNKVTQRRQVTDISWAKASALSRQNVRWWLTREIYIISYWVGSLSLEINITEKKNGPYKLLKYVNGKLNTLPLFFFQWSLDRYTTSIEARILH